MTPLDVSIVGSLPVSRSISYQPYAIDRSPREEPAARDEEVLLRIPLRPAEIDARQLRCGAAA